MSEYKLIEEIISRSVSKKWDLAKIEWKLKEIIDADEPETCLCGHYPINELCELKNIKNGNIATVGNHCVNKFMGISSNKIFDAVKKIRKDIEKSVNIETINFLFNKQLITLWEKKYYEDIHKKRKLTDNQLSKKIEINNKVLSIVKKQRV